MEQKENIASYYLKDLDTETNPGNLLANFFWELFSKSPDLKDIVMMNKIIRLYGRELTFYSILDAYDVEDADVENAYPLLVYMIKNRLSKRENINPSKDMTEYLSKLKNQIEKQKNRKTPIKVKGPNER